MRGISVAGRVAAIGAVVVACVVVAFLLFGGGGGYTVTARFLNGGQLVKGNLVQIGGTKVGTVKEIDITPDGAAVVKLQMRRGVQPAAARHEGHDPPGLAVGHRQPLRRPEDAGRRRVEHARDPETAARSA